MTAAARLVLLNLFAWMFLSGAARATAVGPAPHLPTVSRSSEPLGRSDTGPAPQIQPPAVGALGEKKTLCTMSPIPLWLPAPGMTSCCQTTGRVVREMMFQCWLNSTGMTGWTLSIQRSPSSFLPIF